MGNVFRIAAEELRRLFMNVVSIVISIGLVFMPSLFAWYNVLACWDVFDNTGSLSVAVVTQDAGYKGDLLPVTINIGDRVISGLRGNDDIGWVFTDVDDALDGAKSGRYYAAVIIPETFSEDLLRYCFGGTEQATIIYYSNEKVSAIAPKITDQGADAVSNTINTVLVQSVSEVLLSAVDSVWTYAQDKGVDEAVLALPDDFRSVSGRVGYLADMVDMYATLARDAANLASSTATLVYSVRDRLGEVDGLVGDLSSGSEETLATIRASVDEVIGTLEADLSQVGGLDGNAAADLARARAQVRSALDAYNARLAPAAAALKADVAALVDASSASLDDYRAALSHLGSRLSGLSGQFAEAADQLGETVERLRGTAQVLDDGAAALEEALYSDGVTTLREMLAGDVETLSAALTEPVGIQRVAVYPVENFGSAMAPLYTTLALFIGALLIMVILRPGVGEAVEEAVRKRDSRPIRPWQRFLGHYGIVFVLATLQSWVMAAGCLFFLQVQVVHPWLYVLCFWTASVVFSFVIYTLVALFANLGKAIAVLLLIMQVTGCAGSFPLGLLPEFVQVIRPYLPATHVVAAMRAAMMGLYAGDFWASLAWLAAFGVPFLVAGLIAAGPSSKLVAWYLRRVDASHLMN